MNTTEMNMSNKTYRVTVLYTENRYYTVEAESKEDASEAILDGTAEDWDFCNENEDIIEVEEIDETD